MANNTYEMKDNTFTLFKNEKKQKENSPDYTGDIMVNGHKMRLSAWINESKGGKKYMKGTIGEARDNAPQDKDDF